MAFGKLVDTSFVNHDGTTIQVILERDGYSGTTYSPSVPEKRGYSLKHGQDGESLDQVRANLFAKTELVVTNTTLMTELRKIPRQTARNHRLTLKRGGTIRFKGWCKPDATSTPRNDQETGIVVVQAKDQIKGIDSDWTDSNGDRFTGNKTYSVAIADILSRLNLSLSLEAVVHWRCSTMATSDDPLSTQAPTDAFYRTGGDGTVRPRSSGQVLDDLLATLNCQIIQHDGIWKIHQPGAFPSGQTDGSDEVTVWEYDSAGTQTGTSTRAGAVDITTEDWVEDSDEVGGELTLRDSRVTYDHGAGDTISFGGSFEDLDTVDSNWKFYDSTGTEVSLSNSRFDVDTAEGRLHDGNKSMTHVAKTSAGSIADFVLDADERANHPLGVLTPAAEPFVLTLRATGSTPGSDPNDSRQYWSVRIVDTGGTIWFYDQANDIWDKQSNLAVSDYKNTFADQNIDTATYNKTTRTIPPPDEAHTPSGTLGVSGDYSIDIWNAVASDEITSDFDVNNDGLAFDREAGAPSQTTYRVHDPTIDEGDEINRTVRVGQGPWKGSPGAILDDNGDVAFDWSISTSSDEYSLSMLAARRLLALRSRPQETTLLRANRPSSIPKADRAIDYDGRRYWPVMIEEEQPANTYRIRAIELVDNVPSTVEREVLPGDGDNITDDPADSTGSTGGGETTTAGVTTWQGRDGDVVLDGQDVGTLLEINTTPSPNQAQVDTAADRPFDDGSGTGATLQGVNHQLDLVQQDATANAADLSLQTAILKDAAADPSTNGEIQLNGTDIKAYSGGAVVNLSSIDADTLDGNDTPYFETYTQFSADTDGGFGSTTIEVSGRPEGGSAYESTDAAQQGLGIVGGTDITTNLLSGGDIEIGFTGNVPAHDLSEHDHSTITGDPSASGAGHIIFSDGTNWSSDTAPTAPSDGQVPQWDNTSTHYDFVNGDVTVAGNTVSLGGSTTVDYIDLNDTGSSFPIPNSDLANSSVTVAGNSVSLGGSTSVGGFDLSDFAYTGTAAINDGEVLIGDDTAGEFKLTTLSSEDNITITNQAGGIVIGTDGTVAPHDLSGHDHSTILGDPGAVSAGHLIFTDGTDWTSDTAPTAPSDGQVPEWDNTSTHYDFVAGEVTVAGNTVQLGGSATVDYIDLSDTGSSFPIPNSDLANSSVTVAGNSVSLGGSTSVGGFDLSDFAYTGTAAINDGEVLIGDDTAGEFKLTTLSSEDNITITNQAGGIVIGTDGTVAAHDLSEHTNSTITGDPSASGAGHLMFSDGTNWSSDTAPAGPTDQQVPVWDNSSTHYDFKKIGDNQLANPYARTDIDEEFTGNVGFSVEGAFTNTLGSADAEAMRWGSDAADMLLSLQGGLGRQAFSWNAYFDSANSEWDYMVGAEDACVYGVNIQDVGTASGDGEEFNIGIADGGTADGTITWGQEYAFGITGLGIGPGNSASEALDVTGNITLSGNIQLTTNATVDGVDVDSHSDRHQITGSDSITAANLDDPNGTNGQFLQSTGGSGTQWSDALTETEADDIYMRRVDANATSDTNPSFDNKIRIETEDGSVYWVWLESATV